MRTLKINMWMANYFALGQSFQWEVLTVRSGIAVDEFDLAMRGMDGKFRALKLVRSSRQKVCVEISHIVLATSKPWLAMLLCLLMIWFGCLWILFCSEDWNILVLALIR